MSSPIDLVNTSLVVGALYALTGPNLAAIATLSGADIVGHRYGTSDDNGKKRRQKIDTFLILGIRWGIGSSISIILVGSIVIGIQSDNPNEDWVLMDDQIRIMMQAFVGVFSLILGVYGLVKALENREYNTCTTTEDLDYTNKSKFGIDSVSSAGEGSEITEIVVNNVFTDVEDELSFDSEGSSSSKMHRKDRQEHTPVQRHVPQLDDSLVEKMATCLDISYRSETKPVEETLGLSEFDLRM